VVGDVLLELIARLNAQRDPMADLSAYAAVAAHHGCDRFPQRFPQRHRLSASPRGDELFILSIRRIRQSQHGVCGG